MRTAAQLGGETTGSCGMPASYPTDTYTATPSSSGSSASGRRFHKQGVEVGVVVVPPADCERVRLWVTEQARRNGIDDGLDEFLNIQVLVGTPVVTGDGT